MSTDYKTNITKNINFDSHPPKLFPFSGFNLPANTKYKTNIQFPIVKLCFSKIFQIYSFLYMCCYLQFLHLPSHQYFSHGSLIISLAFNLFRILLVQHKATKTNYLKLDVNLSCKGIIWSPTASLSSSHIIFPCICALQLY